MNEKQNLLNIQSKSFCKNIIQIENIYKKLKNKFI